MILKPFNANAQIRNYYEGEAPPPITHVVVGKGSEGKSYFEFHYPCCAEDIEELRGIAGLYENWNVQVYTLEEYISQWVGYVTLPEP